MLKARFAALAAFVGAVMGCALPAHAQCLDYADGFTWPGLGLGPTSTGPGVLDLLEFDFGNGPRLVVAGNFERAGAIAAISVAVWDGATWAALGDGFNPNADVKALAAFDDGTGTALYASGNFTHSGLQSVPFVAKWDGATWTPVGGGANAVVEALAVFDDGTGPALYASGMFTQIGGVAANSIARWNGTTWSALGSGLTSPGGANASYLATITDGSSSYLAIAGGFSNANGSAVSGFARWTSAGFDVTPLGAPGNAVLCVAMHDDGSGPALYAATAASSPGALLSRKVGSTWTTLITLTNGNVNALVSSSDALGPALFIGGGFRFATASQGRSIIKLQNGTLQTLGGGVEPGANAEVYAIRAFDPGTGSRVYVGGTFTSASGHAASALVPWGESCAAPVITQQPADLTATFPSFAVFSVGANGLAPISYQWRKDGVDLVNATDHILGATTNQLTIVAWTFHDAGDYDCVVTNALGTVTSQPAAFTVPAGGYTNAPVQLTKIMGQHEPVPGGGGALFEYALAGAVLADDSIAYTGVLQSGGTALCRWTPSANELVHRVGGAAPGTAAGVTFQALSRVVSHPSGSYVINADLTGPGVTSANRPGMWRCDGASTTLVARRGETSPNGVAGDITDGLPTTSFIPVQSASGAILYRDYAKRTNGTFGPLTLRCALPSGTRDEVFHTGGAAPGTSSTFTQIDDPVFLGASDTIACSATLTSGTTGFWVGTPGAMTLALLGTDPAPGFVAGTTLNLLGVARISPASDRCFITAVPREAGGTLHRALYAWSPAGLTLIASDLTLPVTENTFFSFTVCAATEDGGVYFTAQHSGSCVTCPTKSFWRADASGLHLIAANRGALLPEVASTWTFNDFLGATANENGEVVFAVSYSLGSARTALFGWTSEAGVFPVAVPGTQIEVASGQYKTVQTVFVNQTVVSHLADQMLPIAPLNEAGVVAFSVTFTDADRAAYRGEFERLASLYVLAPIVISQPESKRIAPGASTTLAAVAIGQELLVYQWRKGGIDVFDDVTFSGSQTATLSIANASEADAGEYTLFVSNAHGVDESEAGVLTVAPGDVFCSGDGALTDHTTDCPCGNHGDPGHGCAHSFDVRGARLSSHGTTTLDDVVLHAEFTPSTSFTLFLQHDAAGDGAFHDGVLCASGSLVRLRGRAASGGESFFPNTSFLNDSLTLSQRGGVFPGQAVNRYYSAWYRNASTTFCPPATANVTNGVRIVW